MSQSGIPGASAAAKVVDVVSTPFTAVPKAIGAIAEGKPIITAVASNTPVANTVATYGKVTQDAGISGARIPVIGGDIINAQNYANDPYSYSNAWGAATTAGKIGGAAIGGQAFGVGSGLTGYGIGSQIQAGNLKGALNNFASEFGGDYSNLLQGASNFLPNGQISRGPATPINSFSNPIAGTDLGVQTSPLPLVIMLGVGVIGYILIKRKKHA